MKTYVLTLPSLFPSYHRRAGQPTYFEKAILDGIKIHSIQCNYSEWVRRFDKIDQGEADLSVRILDGPIYHAQGREIMRLAKENGIGIQCVKFVHGNLGMPRIGMEYQRKNELAIRDGLQFEDWEELIERHDLFKPMAIIHFTVFRY